MSRVEPEPGSETDSATETDAGSETGAPACLRCGTFCTAEVAIHPGLPLCRACVEGVEPMDPRLRPPGRAALRQVAVICGWTLGAGLVVGLVTAFGAPLVQAAPLHPVMPWVIGMVGGLILGVMVMPIVRQRHFEAEAFTEHREAALDALGLARPQGGQTTVAYVRVFEKRPERWSPTVGLDHGLALHRPGVAVLLRLREGVEVLTRERCRRVAVAAPWWARLPYLELELTDDTTREIQVLGHVSRADERVALQRLAEDLRPADGASS